MTQAFLRAGRPSSHGWITVWAVDEHGCLLHPDPICTVPPSSSSWLVPWLESLPCPTTFPDLDTHQNTTPLFTQ